MRHTPLVLIIFLISLGISSSGCGVLIGNVKPVSEKSEDYSAMDLSQKRPKWKRLPSAVSDEEGTRTSDASYQSTETASVISLNSSCRASLLEDARDLRSFTDLLLLGISDVRDREERQLKLQKQDALQTTLTGKMNGQDIRLRAIVLREQDCVYDLMYVAKPKTFDVEAKEFSDFVDSFRLKP